MGEKKKSPFSALLVVVKSVKLDLTQAHGHGAAAPDRLWLPLQLLLKEKAAS